MQVVDGEYLEDMFDLLIVYHLTDEQEDKPKKVYADQVGLF